jgi:cysteine-rich repeat protein
MRFSAIAITVVTLAAQVTLTAGAGPPTTGGFNCKEELDPCMEVEISTTDPCNGNTVTYCLQPKSDAPTSCKSHPSNTGNYSHANVYVNGEMVDVTDQTALPAASCTDEGVDQTSCAFTDTGGTTNSCYALDDFLTFGETTTNVGLKCATVKMGLCVTVPLDNGSHAEIVFAVKDEGGCNSTAVALTDLWKCSSKTDGSGNSCACSGSQTACYRDGITSCPFIPAVCGDGNVDFPGEECDDGNNVSGDGCSATCTIEPGGGGGHGDPHFKTWRRHPFDFHGECDLVLLHSSEFASGLGLDVHIRTKLRRDMSYISGATVRIGTDVLEVDSQGVYVLNGEVGAKLPSELSGFAFSHTQPTDKQHVFAVHLGGRESIYVKTYKDFVSVLIEQGQNKNFGDSVGLMGDFRYGRMIARDGKTVLDDANAFGQEWQVLDTEASLFQSLRLPQHPLECKMPPPAQASLLRRRLSESKGAELAAEKACAHWGEGKDDCVFDVLTTGDLEMAVVGAY